MISSWLARKRINYCNNCRSNQSKNTLAKSFYEQRRETVSTNQYLLAGIFIMSWLFSYFLPNRISTKDTKVFSIKEIVEHNVRHFDVMIFSKSYCPYCVRAKEAIRGQGVDFGVVELDVSMMQRRSNFSYYDLQMRSTIS